MSISNIEVHRQSFCIAVRRNYAADSILLDPYEQDCLVVRHTVQRHILMHG